MLHFGSQPLYAAQPAGGQQALGQQALSQQALVGQQQYSLLAVLSQAQQQLGLAPPATAAVVSNGLFAGFPAPQLQVPACQASQGFRVYGPLHGLFAGFPAPQLQVPALSAAHGVAGAPPITYAFPAPPTAMHGLKLHK